MPKFRVEFAFNEERGRTIPQKDVELPVERTAFMTAQLDLEDAVYLEQDERDSVAMVCVTALEDISAPSVNPKAGPIKAGDVVWQSWAKHVPDFFSDNEAYRKHMDHVEGLIKAYKPLWEAGPEYGFLLEILYGDD